MPSVFEGCRASPPYLSACGSETGGADSSPFPAVLKTYDLGLTGQHHLSPSPQPLLHWHVTKMAQKKNHTLVFVCLFSFWKKANFILVG
jgi:hypothetical protein